MIVPIRNDEEDPQLYVPRWARRSPSVGADAPPISAPHMSAPHAAAPPMSPALDDAPAVAARFAPTPPPSVEAPSMAPGIGGPNIDLPPSRPFEGDLAVKDLRHRLALDPDLVPRPPVRERRGSALPWIGRWLFVLSVAAAVGYAVTMITVRHEIRHEIRQDGALGPLAERPQLVENVSRLTAPLQPARLVVEAQRGFANEPIPLGVSLNGASGEETLTLVGLTNGTKLSAGTPLGLTGWQMSARDLGNAFAYAPRDFIGVMDAAIDLRSARDRLVDSQFVRLEWMPKKESRLAPRPDQPKVPPVIQKLDADEIATLMKRGEEFLRNGDIASARLLLRRAAGAGNAQAALTLGVTFDPAFLVEQGVLGFAPDVPQARAWYERAVELGSPEARRRLDRLPAAR